MHLHVNLQHYIRLLLLHCMFLVTIYFILLSLDRQFSGTNNLSGTTGILHFRHFRDHVLVQ